MSHPTPLFDWHASHGGRLVEFAGWTLPVQYSGIVAEHQAVRAAVGLFDISHMGRLTLAGTDAGALIDHAWTNHAAVLKPGQVRYGLIGNESGGIVDDVLVTRWPESWLMVVNAANRAAVLDRLRKYAVGEDVTIADQTKSTAMMAVQGPKSAATLHGLFADDVSALTYYHAMRTRFGEEECVVSRTGYTGEDGFEVIIAASSAPAVWKAIVGRGAIPCGLGARDTLRLEAAMPLYGHELTAETDPYQAGLGWAVKPDKGEFVGREAMLKHRADAAGRPKRVGLTLSGSRSARQGGVVLREGRPVGRVTSGAPSPTLGRPIAMAYVEPAFAAIGTEVEIDVRGQAEPARVVPLPFYKRPQ